MSHGDYQPIRRQGIVYTTAHQHKQPIVHLFKPYVCSEVVKQLATFGRTTLCMQICRSGSRNQWPQPGSPNATSCARGVLAPERAAQRSSQVGRIWIGLMTSVLCIRKLSGGSRRYQVLGFCAPLEVFCQHRTACRLRFGHTLASRYPE